MAKSQKAIDRLEKCKGYLNKAFKEVYFQDQELTVLMYECYIDNIEEMMSFAMVNDIRLREYFAQLKQILLKLPNTYDRQR